jgi:hypothetical protein
MATAQGSLRQGEESCTQESALLSYDLGTRQVSETRERATDNALH